MNQGATDGCAERTRARPLLPIIARARVGNFASIYRPVAEKAPDGDRGWRSSATERRGGDNETARFIAGDYLEEYIRRVLSNRPKLPGKWPFRRITNLIECLPRKVYRNSLSFFYYSTLLFPDVI